MQALIGFVLKCIIVIGTGVLSWNWTHPESFTSAVGFLILWAIMAGLGSWLVGMVIISMMDK